jgi:ribosomal protein S18 acetylase RimI-like enzyme
MIRTHLGTLDDEGRARAFMRVYEDYVIPVRLTATQLGAHIEVNDVALEESPLWLDDHGDVAALSLFGRRGARGWIGGFGVSPAHRRRGLSGELCAVLLERARALGMAGVQLEVLVNNPHAIRTYARHGFETRRQLLILARAATAGPTGIEHGREIGPWAAPALRDRAPRPVVQPCWQREPESVWRTVGLTCLAADAPDDGFAVTLVGDESIRILALHARDAGLLAALVTDLVGRFPARSVMLLNEPEESPLCPWLAALGFEERMRQHEMVAALG